MAYEKRICVLHQIKKGFTADGGALSGALYAERLGSELTVTPRILGIAPVKEGRYALAVWAAGSTYCLPFEGNTALRISNAPSIREGFAAILVYLRGEAEPLAFGRCGNAPVTCESLLAAFREEVEKKRKRPIPTPLPPNELPGPAPNVPLAPGVPLPDEIPEEDARPFRECVSGYDDEAIAADDYFRGEQGDGVSHADEGLPSSAHKKEQAQKNGRGAREDAAPLNLDPRGSLTYYKEVRAKLDEAFKTLPKDERLKGAFPQSEWVRSNGALIGIIYAEGVPRYLCVAVEKTGDPPAEVKENAVFVPKSAFSEEEGFWVVFQDADTGAYVNVDNS